MTAFSASFRSDDIGVFFFSKENSRCVDRGRADQGRADQGRASK